MLCLPPLQAQPSGSHCLGLWTRPASYPAALLPGWTGRALGLERQLGESLLESVFPSGKWGDAHFTMVWKIKRGGTFLFWIQVMGSHQRAAGCISPLQLSAPML